MIYLITLIFFPSFLICLIVLLPILITRLGLSMNGDLFYLMMGAMIHPHLMVVGDLLSLILMTILSMLILTPSHIVQNAEEAE